MAWRAAIEDIEEAMQLNMELCEQLLEQFFLEHLRFYVVSEDIWDYNNYLSSCVVGGELNTMQWIAGVYFVTNGVSTHICGSEEDLTGFYLYMKWAYEPDGCASAYPNIEPSDYPVLDEREVTLFYHQHREFYEVAWYFAFREYLWSKVPGGVMQYRVEEHAFYFVNEHYEYLVGLPGELELFRRWCASVHDPNREDLFCTCFEGDCGVGYGYDCVESKDINDPMGGVIEGMEQLEKLEKEELAFLEKRRADLWEVQEDEYW